MVAYPQLLGAIKNKTGGLDNYKGFARQPRVRAGLNDKTYLLHKANTSRLGEVVISSNSKKLTQKAKQNEETMEYDPNERR